MVNKNQKHKIPKVKTLRCSAATITEVIMSLSIMAIIFTAILPLTRGIQNSWDSKKGSTETLQNGRVFTEHLTRNLSKASEITAVSEASETNGFIEYLDNDGSTMRYDVNNGYVEFGPVGNLSTLAGPVSQLQFASYNILDIDTPIADVNNVTSIRFVKAEATMTNPAEMAQDKTFTTSAFLYTNANPTTEEGYDPNLVAYYPFEGNYNNVITGRPADPCGPTIAIASDPNHPERGQFLGLYTQGEKIKAVVVQGDYVNCGNDDVGHIDTAITIACWEKVNDLEAIVKSSACIIGKSYPWKFQVNSSTSIVFSMSQLEPLGANPVSTTTIFDGQWHHLVGVYDGTIQALYVDGQLQAFEVKTGLVNTWDGYTFLIGSETNKLATFPGLIDDVCVYDDALDANEVLDLYLNGPSVAGGGGEAQVLP